MLSEVEKNNFREAICSYLAKYNQVRELRIVQISEMSFNYSNTDFGIDYYGLSFKISPIEFIEYADDIDHIQTSMLAASKLFLRDIDNSALSHVSIGPKLSGPVANKTILKEDKEKIAKLLTELKAVLIGVSTGGPRIQQENEEYISKKDQVNKIFGSLGLGDTGLFKDLWEWYGVWSSGSYPSYQSRRVFISELISTLQGKIEQIGSVELPEVDLTGTQRLDRAIREIRFRYSDANTEEQWQAIGVLCRESLITLAQMAYLPEKHLQYCDTAPSSTDTKRMLDAFIQSELGGSSNEILRRYAKAANDLANELTHRRTATKKDAVICVNATFSVVNICFAMMNKVESTSI